VGNYSGFFLLCFILGRGAIYVNLSYVELDLRVDFFGAAVHRIVPRLAKLRACPMLRRLKR
jgi:hypothetical protein